MIDSVIYVTVSSRERSSRVNSTDALCRSIVVFLVRSAFSFRFFLSDIGGASCLSNSEPYEPARGSYAVLGIALNRHVNSMGICTFVVYSSN